MGWGNYILDDDNRPVRVDIREAVAWREAHPDRRIVKQEDVGGYRVSTVFLQLDHSFADDATPVLWETLVFDRRDPNGVNHWSEIDGDRYTSHEDALAGHEVLAAKWRAAANEKRTPSEVQP
jgi:hypothetical protein